MAKRSAPDPEVPPSLTKQQGIRALGTMREKGAKLLAARPIPEAVFDTWTSSTIEYIQQTFGSRSPHISNFIGPVQIQVTGYDGPDERYLEAKRAEGLEHRIAALGSLIEQLETDMALESPVLPVQAPADELIWPLLHPKVVAYAKARFDAGHFADAVEAALKELNTAVKELVKKKTGQELDGASLMLKAFSVNNPIVALDDLSTESGKNIQEGYMHIFAGAMKGVRNPKAHSNLTITRERAIHFLFLASLLFYKLDERP